MTQIGPDKTIHVGLSQDRGEAPVCMDGARINGLYRDFAEISSDKTWIDIYDGGNNCGNDPVVVWSGSLENLETAVTGGVANIYASELAEIKKRLQD